MIQEKFVKDSSDTKHVDEYHPAPPERLPLALLSQPNPSPHYFVPENWIHISDWDPWQPSYRIHVV